MVQMVAAFFLLHLIAGTLLKRKDVLPGYSYLDITIEKIELKDPQNYIDPFITVSVKSQFLAS